MSAEDITPPPAKISLDKIELRNGHKPAIVWLTGLSGAGKSSVAADAYAKLFQQNCHVFMLDGDDLRTGLSKGLTFTNEDRKENIRRAGEVAKLFFRSGAIVICSFISPFKADRDLVKALVPDGYFFEIYIDCSIEECIRRDPKNLYKKALNNSIANFTGISSPYERPEAPALTINTEINSIAQSGDMIIYVLKTSGITR